MKLSTKNVNAEITRIAKTGRTMRDDIQRVLSFAITYCIAERNPLYLTTLRDALDKRTGVSTKTLHGYILSAVSGVTYAENKNGKMIYRVKAKDSVVERTETVKVWVDWKPENHEQAEYDMAKFIRMLESKASPKEGVKVSAEVQASAKHFLSELNEDAQQAA